MDHLSYFSLVFVVLSCASVCWCLVVTCWERADPLVLVCDVLIVKLSLSPLVSWVRCGAWLYRFLIFVLFLTLINNILAHNSVHLPFPFCRLMIKVSNYLPTTPSPYPPLLLRYCQVFFSNFQAILIHIWQSSMVRWTHLNSFIWAQSLSVLQIRSSE